MALVKNTNTGRYDADQPSAMKRVRPPVFVDNCVHHAIYLTDSTSKKMKVTPSTRGEFQVTHGRSYLTIEEESAIRLIHNQMPGHNYTGNVYFNDGKLTSTATIPSILYGADDDSLRLVGKELEAATTGSRLVLNNMKGRNLVGIGFDEPHVRLGQEIDVGLRTTALALKLAEPTLGKILPSVNISDKNKISTTNEERVKHSRRFLSQDFYGVNLVTALRYIGRHDGRILYNDRWGNLLYLPFRTSGTDRTVQGWFSFGNQTNTSVDNSPNRITILGKQRALNHLAHVTMDDRSNQIIKDGSETIREDSPISDPSVKNLSSARRVARQVLRAHESMKGKRKQTGIPHAWDIKAGDVVRYEGGSTESEIITVSHAVHRLQDKKTDLEFLSLSTGVEGVLQGVTESALSMGDLMEDNIVQSQEENFSFFMGMEIRTNLYMRERIVHNKGKRLGSHNGSIIGRKVQGGVQTVGSIVGGSGYSAGTAATTGGTGTGCTVTYTVAAGAINAITAIPTGGTGYTVGDVLTVAGGGGNATITVTAVQSENDNSGETMGSSKTKRRRIRVDT